MLSFFITSWKAHVHLLFLDVVRKQREKNELSSFKPADDITHCAYSKQKYSSKIT